MKKWYKIFNGSPLKISSPSAMKQLGIDIGRLLEPGETLGIVGNLGAGKTHLSQGIIEGLGSAMPASSPTFSLVHEHTDGRIPAFHFDFYRLEHERELASIAWDDYLDRNGVILVEWADLFPQALPNDTTWLLVTPVNEQERQVEIKNL